MEINHLKKYRKIPPTTLPASTDHIPDLQDTKILLGHISDEVMALMRVYAVTETIKLNSSNRVVLPTDLYENVDRISRMVSALERSENVVVEPTHVYRLANTIVIELQRFSENTPPNITASNGKRPRDVYNKAHILLQKIEQLSRNPNYKVKGGVVLLKKDGGHIIPADVFNVLVNVLAEVDAMDRSIGTTSVFRLAPIEQHKTPSDVFDKVSEAIALVEALL